MAQPKRIDELDAVTSLSSAAAVAIVQANATYRTTPAAFITQAESFTQSGSGASSRTVQAKLREIVSVTDFGATGDGSTDDRTAINNALTAGAAVYFPDPATRYLVSAGLTATTATKVYGVNAFSTMIRCSDNTADILTFPSDADYVHVADLGLEFSTKSTGDCLVFTNSNNDLVVDRVFVSKGDIGINSKNVSFVQTYNNCRADDCNTGYFVEGRTSGGSGAGTTAIFNQCWGVRCNTTFHLNTITEVMFNQPIADYAGAETAPKAIFTENCTLVQVKQLTLEGTIGADGYGVRCQNSTLEILSLDGAKVDITATGYSWYLYSVSSGTATCKVEVRNVAGRQATDCKEYLMQNDAGGVIVLNKFNNEFGTEINGTDVTNVNGELIERDFDRGVKATVVELFDDFLGDVLADQWNTRVGSDGQCTAFAIRASQPRGLIRGVTGDDAGATMALNGIQVDSDLNWRADQSGLVMEFRVVLPAITLLSLFIGLTDQIAALEAPITSAASGDTITTNATDAVGVMFDTSMATDNWWLVGVANNVDATAQDAGVAPTANVAEVWRIEVSKAGTATFYRNGTQIGTAMTVAVTATAGLTPVVTAFSRGAVQRNVDLDYIMVQAKR